MKVIFLDVDGVIAPFSSPGVIKDEKLELLKQLVIKTNSKIVLSSSWRKYCDNGSDAILNPYTYLLEKFDEYDLKIYDIIPIKQVKILTHEFISSSGAKVINRFFDPYSIRSGEIKEWLDNNEVNSFVILDDEDFNYKYFSLDDNLVMLDPNRGIELEDIEKAIKILNCKNKVKTK